MSFTLCGIHFCIENVKIDDTSLDSIFHVGKKTHHGSIINAQPSSKFVVKTRKVQYNPSRMKKNICIFWTVHKPGYKPVNRNNSIQDSIGPIVLEEINIFPFNSFNISTGVLCAWIRSWPTHPYRYIKLADDHPSLFFYAAGPKWHQGVKMIRCQSS